MHCSRQISVYEYVYGWHGHVETWVHTASISSSTDVCILRPLPCLLQPQPPSPCGDKFADGRPALGINDGLQI